jgi:hypothetical protein
LPFVPNSPLGRRVHAVQCLVGGRLFGTVLHGCAEGAQGGKLTLTGDGHLGAGQDRLVDVAFGAREERLQAFAVDADFLRTARDLFGAKHLLSVTCPPG